MAGLCKVAILEKDGTEYEIPVEASPLTDYASLKGMAFEGLDTYKIEKIGKIITEKIPNASVKPTFLANGDIDFVEYFDGFTQTTPNRIAKTLIGYTGGNPTTETVYIYDSDGTTILRTSINTYTYSGYDLTKVETSTT